VAIPSPCGESPKTQLNERETMEWAKSRKRDQKGGWVSDDGNFLIYRFGKFYSVKDLQARKVLTHGNSFNDAVTRLSAILEKESK
jgi:hypothetical protein